MLLVVKQLVGQDINPPHCTLEFLCGIIHNSQVNAKNLYFILLLKLKRNIHKQYCMSCKHYRYARKFKFIQKLNV